MGAVLGALGFAMGLIAIWLAVEAAKRVDGRGEGMVRPHVRGLKNRIAETNARLGDLDIRLTKIEHRLTAARMESRAARDLAEETRAIRYGLQRSREAVQTASVYHA